MARGAVSPQRMARAGRVAQGGEAGAAVETSRPRDLSATGRRASRLGDFLEEGLTLRRQAVPVLCSGVVGFGVRIGQAVLGPIQKQHGRLK